MAVLPYMAMTVIQSFCRFVTVRFGSPRPPLGAGIVDCLLAFLFDIFVLVFVFVFGAHALALGPFAFKIL
jgi:hypothetical protein